jgi:murein DD-endopeptidase MepM/ murein hydrolase activator NlpD
LPDPRRLYRRITASTLPTRLVSHLTVVSIVAVASMAGLATQQTPDAGVDTGFLVSAVRGANDGAPAPSHRPLLEVSEDSEAVSLQADELELLDRGAPAVVPSSTPRPTPVPIDTAATPLPGPTTAAAAATPAAQGAAAATPAAQGAAAATPAAQGATTTTPSAPSTRTTTPAAPARLAWPVPGGSVSQYFHAGHLAIDIAAPYGNQVVAAQSGIVTWAGWRNNGGGFVVSIDHGNGMRTTYNHLGAVWVSAGQWVGAGQLIAPVGCTGICTGPHVHFEVVVNGVIDNPLRYF